MTGYYYNQSCCSPCYPKKASNKVRFTTDTNKKVFIAEVTFKGFGEVEVGTVVQGEDSFCLQVPPGVKEMIVHVLISKKSESDWSGFEGDEAPWGSQTQNSQGISAAWHVDLCTNCTTALFMSNYFADASTEASCTSDTCGSLQEPNQSTMCVNCNACSSCCCRPNCCTTPASAANVTGSACDNCTEIRFTISY